MHMKYDTVSFKVKEYIQHLCVASECMAAFEWLSMKKYAFCMLL